MTSETPVRVAVIGAGLIGPRHAQTVTSDPSTQLTAIVDPTPSGARSANTYNVPHYTSVADLLSSPDKPQAAIICTPNHTHAPIGLELIRAGVHILVEKPVATDIASGQTLIEAARGSGVKILVGHHRRFNSYVIAAKQIIDSRTIGNPIAINGLWTTYKPPEYFDPPAQWRASSANGGGVILINMIHEIDILHHLLGPITRVHCEPTQSQRHKPEQGHEHTAEEGAAITLRFRSGVVGTFLICDATPSAHNFESATGENPLIPQTGKDIYRIFGTEGSLSVPELSVSSYEGRPQKSWHEQIGIQKIDLEDDGGTPFGRQLAHLIDVVRGIEEPRCTGDDGLAALVVCEALKRSIEERRPVDVNIEELR